MSEKTAKKRKLDDSDEGNDNTELSDMLIELADFEKNVTRNIYKSNAYRKAAKSIKNHTRKIKSGKEAKGLEGVGEKIAEKIDEYLKNGKISRLEKVRVNSDAQAINELVRVTGIGPSAAKKFLDEGIRNLDDLRKNIDKLNTHQKIGLLYLEELEQKIPRDEMIKLRDFVFQVIESIDPKYTATVCGSFRRGAGSSSDIDILLTHSTYVSETFRPDKHDQDSDLIVHAKNSSKSLLSKIVKKLEEEKFLTDTLAHGDSKYMGVCLIDKIHRRIDLRLVPKDQFYCGILYFTGSDMFNKNMRKIALEKGYTLNEYRLVKIGSKGIKSEEALKINSEKDIFDYLGMEYKAPEERNM